MSFFRTLRLVPGVIALILIPVCSELPPAMAQTAPQAGNSEKTVPRTQPDAPELAKVKPLYPGDPAPAIKIASWAKGSPVKEFRKDTVYVVEFWATWCGPCRTSMPYLSSLQTEYGNKVQFIGVTDEDAQTVKEFLSQPGSDEKTWSEIITYTIALDQKSATSDAYMLAANQNGIPTAFVVGKSGKVEWFGHPMEIGQPLSQIVAGTWDLKTARETHITAIREEEALTKVLPGLRTAMEAENYQEAARIMKGLLKEFPKSERFQMVTLQVLLEGGLKEEANSHAAIVIENFRNNAETLDQIAWMMATMNPDGGIADLELATKAALRAVEVSKNTNSSAMDTLARVHFEKGNFDEAISWQKKAIAISPGNTQFAETLTSYEAARDEAKKGQGDAPKPQ